MRILYVASTYSHIANFHLPYIDALRRTGNEVYTLANGEGADFCVPFAKRFFSKENARARRMIKKILREGGYDLIILNTTLAAFHTRLAIKSARKRPRVVNVVHGYLFSRGDGFLRRSVLSFCERIMRSRTDSIITMNKEDYEIALSSKFTRGRVYLSRGMGCAVRESVSSVDDIRTQSGSVGAFVISFVGELSERKNQRFLIQCMPEIRAAVPNVRLLLVGEGDLRGELMSLCNELSVSDCVVFMGARRDACDVMRASDVYVSAARSEGLPFNIVEALGLARCVVASDIKGHSDIITDELNGYLFPQGNKEAFVSLVLKAYAGTVPSEDDIRLAYERFSLSSVFAETLGMIKEAGNVSD